MNINKAIRKQNRAYKNFVLSMGFIFLILPLVLILTKRFTMFFIAYLAIIEILIFIVILVNVNSEYLKFEYDDYKLKIRLGLLKEVLNILCDKVALIHTENKDKEIDITIIASSRFRSKSFKPVDIYFLKKYSYIAYHYYRIKKQHPENEYFYYKITKGGFVKYKLLDTIYKSCVYAYFTEESLERIKEYRM